MSDALFDREAFTSPQDSGKEFKRARQRQSLYRAREGSSLTPDNDWWIITIANEGTLDKVHRIAETLDHGSVLTICNIVGRPLQRIPTGTEAYLCEGCGA